MDRTALAAVVLGLLVVLLALMVLGWRARRRRQSGIPEPAHVPAELGAVRLETRGLYVATTEAGHPLERIVVGGLGFRADVELRVADAGLALELRGERDVFIAARDVREAGRATYTIDRAVERDGLVVVRWSLGSTEVETYLRVERPDELLAAIDSLLTPSTGSETP